MALINVVFADIYRKEPVILGPVASPFAVLLNAGDDEVHLAPFDWTPLVKPADFALAVTCRKTVEGENVFRVCVHPHSPLAEATSVDVTSLDFVMEVDVVHLTKDASLATQLGNGQIFGFRVSAYGGRIYRMMLTFREKQDTGCDEVEGHKINLMDLPDLVLDHLASLMPWQAVSTFPFVSLKAFDVMKRVRRKKLNLNWPDVGQLCLDDLRTLKTSSRSCSSLLLRSNSEDPFLPLLLAHLRWDNLRYLLIDGTISRHEARNIAHGLRKGNFVNLQELRIMDFDDGGLDLDQHLDSDTGPWICPNLRKLTVSICLGDPPPDDAPHPEGRKFFASLTKLQSLNLYLISSDVEGREADLLASLSSEAEDFSVLFLDRCHMSRTDMHKVKRLSVATHMLYDAQGDGVLGLNHFPRVTTLSIDERCLVNWRDESDEALARITTIFACIDTSNTVEDVAFISRDPELSVGGVPFGRMPNLTAARLRLFLDEPEDISGSFANLLRLPLLRLVQLDLVPSGCNDRDSMAVISRIVREVGPDPVPRIRSISLYIGGPSDLSNLGAAFEPLRSFLALFPRLTSFNLGIKATPEGSWLERAPDRGVLAGWVKSKMPMIAEIRFEESYCRYPRSKPYPTRESFEGYFREFKECMGESWSLKTYHTSKTLVATLTSTGDLGGGDCVRDLDIHYSLFEDPFFPEVTDWP